jgi:hypothetical protein
MPFLQENSILCHEEKLRSENDTKLELIGSERV